MSPTNFPRFVIMLIAMIVSITLRSQTTKEAVILYNTIPVLAEISQGGTVNKIIKEDPDFLKGFELKVQDYGQLVSETKVPLTVSVKQSQSYDIISNELTTIPFEGGYATLSDLAISRLDYVIEKLRKDASINVVMRTLSTVDTSLLSKNRLNSVRTYLRLRGVALDRIKFESLAGERTIDEVKVHLIH